jgi:hypothetical protein
MTGMEMIQLGIRAYLREMDDVEWSALVKDVRPPNSLPRPGSGATASPKTDARI